MKLEADAAQMRLFLNTIFKHCAGIEGWAVLRAFEHEREGAAVVNKWVPFDKDLSLVAIETATHVANRTGAQRAVFSPPVAVFGEGMNAKGDKRFGGESNVIAAPAVAVELDSNPQEALATLKGILGEPTLVIASGGSWEGQPKLHVYWRLGKPARTDEERATLKYVRLMAARLVGADESGVTLSHPMRWPGSWHTKGAPKLCEIVDVKPTRDITLEFAVGELQAAIDEAGIDLEKRHSDGRADRNGFKTEKAWERGALFAAADLIPNPPELEWNPWSNAVMAFYDASHGSVDGLEAVIYWSNKNPKGDEETTAAKWAHVEKYPPANLSAGTLVKLARDVDPEFSPDRIKPEEWFNKGVDTDHVGLEWPEEPDTLSSSESGQAKSEFFEVLTIDQLFTRPDPVFLLDRHIPEKSVGFLYGDPGTGKSFIALDWALHVAFERPDWFGDAIRNKAEGCVIYIAGEGASGFKSRVAAWQHRRGVGADQKGRFGLIHQSVDFMSGEDIKRLVGTLRRVVRSPVSMIVVDTVSRAMPGADENLQKEMTLFVKACDVVRDAFDCAVVGVHHAGKSGDMRGSTVLRGAGDYVFKLERKRGASIGRLICEKQKDAPDGWSDAYRFDVVTLGPDRSSLVPERCEEKLTGDAVLTPDTTQLVLEAMQAAWDSGEPWGRHYQSGDRMAARRMTRDFGFTMDRAEEVLDIWLGSGTIVEDVLSRKDKRKGLRPTDITSASDVEEGVGNVFE